MNYRLWHYRNEEFSLEFPDHPLHGNVFSTIIGPNGSGKSRILADIAMTMKSRLAESEDGGEDTLARVLAISNMVYDQYPLSSAGSPDYMYLGVRQGANMVTTGVWAEQTTDAIAGSWLLPVKLKQLRPALELLGVSVKQGPEIAVHPKAREEWPRRLSRLDATGGMPYSGRSNREGIPAIYVQAVEQVRKELPTAKRRDRQFQHDYQAWAPVGVVEGIANNNNIPPMDFLEFLLAEKLIYTRVVFEKAGRRCFVADLSAGEQLVLSNAARILRHIVPNSLVLIDEPEIGLHPEWQSRFIPLLREMIPESYGCHFIIATHSPHIVVEGTQLIVPDAKHGTFKSFEGQYEGRSVENLLYRAFESRSAHNLLVEADLAHLIKVISRGSITPSNISRTREAIARLRKIAGDDTPEVNKILSQVAELLSW